jgi:hypothetical protein
VKAGFCLCSILLPPLEDTLRGSTRKVETASLSPLLFENRRQIVEDSIGLPVQYGESNRVAAYKRAHVIRKRFSAAIQHRPEVDLHLMGQVPQFIEQEFPESHRLRRQKPSQSIDLKGEASAIPGDLFLEGDSRGFQVIT